MSLPVYSVPFILFTQVDQNTQFDVPPGYTAVIRQYSVWQDVGGWEFVLNIGLSSISYPVSIVGRNQTGVDTYVAGEGRWAVPGGGYIEIYVSHLGTSVAIYVGGYLLRDAGEQLALAPQRKAAGEGERLYLPFKMGE